MQPYEIRQRRNGTIDYDNYCARPLALPHLPASLRQAAMALRALGSLAAAIAVLAVFHLLAG
jgi:hypothetical protein